MKSLYCTLVTILFGATLCYADIYTVTSSQCQGAGSIVGAVEQANLNPGPDTIEFAVDKVYVESSSCGVSAIGDPDFFYLATVQTGSGDLIINGNGAELIGAPLWITIDGLTNLVGLCPGNIPGAIIAREAPGFLRINEGTNVEINDLTVQKLSAFVNLRDSSSLTINRVTAFKIYDWFRGCDRSAIDQSPGENPATLVINDSIFAGIRNSQRDIGLPDGAVVRLSAVLGGRGDLSVSNTSFQHQDTAINWKGNANIETSQFKDGGWINIIGPGTTNIVNSVFQGFIGPSSKGTENIRASTGAVVNVSASTMAISYPECGSGGAACVNGYGTVIAVSGATVNLNESALGVAFPSEPNEILRTATTGNITADTNTWIQPVAQQDAATLRAITGQSSLLTEPPGLPAQFLGYPLSVVPLLGTTGNPGKLIDAIPDASPGGSNELKSPIDNSTITLDVFGNNRVDGNGKRNIGAIQLSLTPHVWVTDIKQYNALVHWSRPLPPSEVKPITGYGVTYEPTDGSRAPVRIDIANPDTLYTTLTGLSNDTEYRVSIVAVNADGDGPATTSQFTTLRFPWEIFLRHLK